MKRSRLVVTGILLAAAHLLLGYVAVRSLSATFDEPMHVAAGYSYWARGDMRMDPNNPPLAKLLVSAPMLASRVRVAWNTREWEGAYHYAFGERLLYWNGNDGDSILAGARLTVLLLSTALLLLLWRWSAGKWGEAAGLATAAVYAASPSVLAHASLATNDLIACFFATAGLLACVEFAESGDPGAAAAAGLAAAAATLSKYSGVLLVPVYALVLCGRVPRGRLLTFAKRAGAPWLAVLGVYFGAYPNAWAGFATRVWQVAAGTHPVFVLGRVYPSGWPGTYAVALLTKSTPVELAILAWGAWTWRSRKAAADRAPWALLVVYFLAASASHKQIGLRYMLPVYPALALIAGSLVGPAAAARGRRLAFLLAAGQLASAVLAAPDDLAYFNAFCGGSSRGYRLLRDSNLDWGQDLKKLSAYLRAEGEPEVILSYFGSASPEYHGVLAQSAGSTNAVMRLHVNTPNPTRELFVISASNLNGPLGWVAERPALARVGSTLFVYDVTDDGPFHERLSSFYVAEGDKLLAERESARARALSKKE